MVTKQIIMFSTILFVMILTNVLGLPSGVERSSTNQGRNYKNNNKKSIWDEACSDKSSEDKTRKGNKFAEDNATTINSYSGDPDKAQSDTFKRSNRGPLLRKSTSKQGLLNEILPATKSGNDKQDVTKDTFPDPDIVGSQIADRASNRPLNNFWGPARKRRNSRNLKATTPRPAVISPSKTSSSQVGLFSNNNYRLPCSKLSIHSNENKEDATKSENNSCTKNDDTIDKKDVKAERTDGSQRTTSDKTSSSASNDDVSNTNEASKENKSSNADETSSSASNNEVSTTDQESAKNKDSTPDSKSSTPSETNNEKKTTKSQSHGTQDVASKSNGLAGLVCKDKNDSSVPKPVHVLTKMKTKPGFDKQEIKDPSPSVPITKKLDALNNIDAKKSANYGSDPDPSSKY